MDFKDILKKDIDKNYISLGNNEVEELLIDINKYPSIIITGETGSGKSILLDQIILQLINKYTSLELGIIPIDTSGVELNYYAESPYTLYNAINNEDKSIVALTRVLKEVERRKDLLKENGVTTAEQYNQIVTSKLPLLLVAIDDDKLLLRNRDMEKLLSGIISQLTGLNILFVLATSDVHNKFFERDNNTLASLLISFDYTNSLEAQKANIEGSQNLAIGEFLARKDNEVSKYRNYEFDDAIIAEVLAK
ncbi:MAG: AAA family ATPase [Bacilli bacterium]|nr:AAA family ATPase [Bacilli bacterium]